MVVETSGRVMVAILAAGASRRMGRPKLLLPYRDSSGSETCLLERACSAACASRASSVIVICGSSAGEARKVVDHLADADETCSRGRLTVLFNANWEHGQSTSVALAAHAALKEGFDALVVMTADQPFVETRHLDALMDSFAAGSEFPVQRLTALRASRAGKNGNPCLFARSTLPSLLGLRGDEGARQLFASGVLVAESVPFDGPNDEMLFFDVDEPDDFDRISTTVANMDYGPQALDPDALRIDFPLLDRTVGMHGETVCYLDSAATALVPEPVRLKVDQYLASSCANVHRGAHLLAEESTEAYESAREHLARFIGASDPNQLVFTHGTTESLNLVAQCWAAANLSTGDSVLLTEDAHHAAIVPFQMLAERTGIKTRFVRVWPNGLIDEESWSEGLALQPRLVVLTHTSNVLGFIQPRLATMIEEAHRRGALVALDAAQTIGHAPFSVDESLCDFVAFSAHKMHALTGLGALWCSQRALDSMRPMFGGGGMIERVTVDGYSPASAPAAFEPGTPSIAAAVSLDAALAYLEGIGIDAAANHTTELCRCTVDELKQIDGVRILGPLSMRRTSLVSFSVEGVHPHDLSSRLSDLGIMVRAGHHCAMPLHRALGVPASVRASFAVHSTRDDVERLIEGVRSILNKER